METHVLKTIADALYSLSASPYHGQGKLRLSPVDVINRVLEPARAELILNLSLDDFALPWVRR